MRQLFWTDKALRRRRSLRLIAVIAVTALAAILRLRAVALFDRLTFGSAP